jgi:hypothetical protein
MWWVLMFIWGACFGSLVTSLVMRRTMQKGGR